MKKEEKIIKDFIQPLRSIILSDKKAHDMRERLIAYTDLHAMPALGINKKPQRPVLRTSFSFSYSRVVAVALAVVVLLVGGTGITFAAENSVPGDPLYVVKVSVAEPIQGAFIGGTENKAKWENTLADRRLTEASTLAVQNKLTPQTSSYLEQQVATDVAQSNNYAAKLEASGNTYGALAVRSDLDARLSAHEAILALITPQAAPGGDATTTLAVVNFLGHVNSIDTKVAQEEIATELTLTNPSAAATPSSTPSPTTSSSDSSNTAIAYVDAQNTAKQHEERAIFSAQAKLFGVLLSTSTTASTSPLNIFPITTASTTPPEGNEFSSSTEYHLRWHAQLPIAIPIMQVPGN